VTRDPATLVLVRHGETPWHAENRYTGVSDIGLTPTGTGQAAELAAWAAMQPITAVVTSPLRRAHETASPSAEALGLPVTIDKRLSEVDFGAGEGHTRDEMAEIFPDALSRFLDAPASNPLPGGEPGVAAVDRAWPAVEDLAAGGGTVLLVAHSTLLRLLLCRMLGIFLDDYRRRFPALRNTATTTVRLDAGGAALLSLNVPVTAAR
jgi:probable phosphoglycerate mutase